MYLRCNYITGVITGVETYCRMYIDLVGERATACGERRPTDPGACDTTFIAHPSLCVRCPPSLSARATPPPSLRVLPPSLSSLRVLPPSLHALPTPHPPSVRAACPPHRPFSESLRAALSGYALLCVRPMRVC